MLRTQHYMPTLEAQWSEPVDLPFPLCQPILNCSLAAVEADNDSTTYHMEAQCGAGSQPKSDLLSAHTRYCGDGPMWDNGLSRLISDSYFANPS